METYENFCSEMDFPGAISFSYSLSKLSWLKVGGPVDVLFRPRSIEDLTKFIKNIPDSITITPIGVCSNLLVRDGGLNGIAIKLGNAFTEIKYNEDEVKIGAGNLDSRVAIHLSKFDFDMSFLRTIPGTIGGALKMNAGCYGHSFGDYVSSIEGIKRDGTLVKLKKEDLKFIYRNCCLPEPLIITTVFLKPRRLNRILIEKKMIEALEQRKKTQPVQIPSCGSTFKNPDGSSSKIEEKKLNLKAWNLIDEAGLRGKKIGRAQVSEKHPNFLLNLGGAKASEIEELGEFVRKKVLERHNILLEWELIRMGKK